MNELSVGNTEAYFTGIATAPNRPNGSLQDPDISPI